MGADQKCHCSFLFLHKTKVVAYLSYRFNCINLELVLDPPYNTGSDGFVYPDNFSFNADKLSNMLGINEEEAERIINLKGKSSHSAWLTFMYPRLLLARELLSDDGVIFISIDENEFTNLKMACDEIFGEENFIENFIWIKNANKNLSKTTSTNHEYIFCYSKNINCLIDKQIFRVKKKGLDEVNRILNEANLNNWSEKDTEKKLKEFYKSNKDLKGITMYDKVERRTTPSGQTYLKVYTLDNMSAPMSSGKAETYDLIHPKTGQACVTPSRGWAYTRQTMEEHLKNNMIYFYEDHTNIPRFKRFLDTVTTEVKKSVINDFNDGKKVLQKLFGEANFDNSKPVSLMQSIFEILDKDSIILDFFSGSATTAHAVMQLNAEIRGGVDVNI